jgi:hypothetical protein
MSVIEGVGPTGHQMPGFPPFRNHYKCEKWTQTLEETAQYGAKTSSLMLLDGVEQFLTQHV